MAIVKHEKLVTLLKTNYPKDATEIADCLEMVNMGLEGASESINVVMHSALKEKDYTKLRTLTDYLEEIAGIQQLIETYAEMFDAETDSEEVETEDLLDKEQRLLPDYAKYAVDPKIAHSLYESFTFKRPTAFIINGKKYAVNDWKEMLLKTCSLLAQIDKEMFKKLPTSPAFKGRKTTYFGMDYIELKNAKIPGTDLYVWTNMSANAIRNIIRRLLKYFGVKIADVSVYFKADYSPLHEDPQRSATKEKSSLTTTDFIDLNIPQIRIVPMNSSLEFTGKTNREIQKDFFNNDLPNKQKCKYHYATSGLNSNENALILFQSYNEIIACARLKKVEAFDTINKDGSKGAFHLYPDSIRIFEPISYNELIAVCPDATIFCQVKQNLDVGALPKLLELIDKKATGYIL